MHCRCDFFRSWSLLALILASAALTARDAARDQARGLPIMFAAAATADGTAVADAPLAVARRAGAGAARGGALEYRYQAGP